MRWATLLENIWDRHFDPESNAGDMHVGNLRRELSRAAGRGATRPPPGVGFSLRNADDSLLTAAAH